MRPPLWQRIWLDLLLLIPASYGTYILINQGSLFTTTQTLSNGSPDPLSDPLLFLVPSLSVLAFSLLSVRGLHHVLEGFAWLIAHTRATGLVLAVRQLARSRVYQAPLLILIFTLSLSIYTASLAKTLDQHLTSRVFYEVGSEANFTKVGQEQLTGVNVINNSEVKDDSLSFPVNEFLKIPGIEKAIRVGSYPAYASMVIGGVEKGRFIGVDRTEFSTAAYWRPDFAQYPLGQLMNLLASSPEGILASRGFLEENGLNPGDPLEIRIATDLGRVVMIGTIVGSFELFPTWYSEVDGPLFIGNLETVFDLAGGFTNYQVWVKTNSSFDFRSISKIILPGLNVKVLSWKSSPPRITTIQERPEQQGVFGFLVIGFACAALLTVVGLLMYALFSYRQRYIELGVLRAIGLDKKQMGFSLAVELLFLLFFGGLIGTSLGLWASNLYIPFLQIGQKPFERVPPFEVVIDWPSIIQIYLLFSGLFIFVMILLISALQRMKIFQAIKLGETL
jgi:putative ABC transport system permease protein